MAAPLALREDFDALALRGLAKKTRDAWRLIDLAQWVWEEYRIRVAKQTLSRQLRTMGFRKLSARPRHHAHNEHAAEAFKKTSPTCWRRSRAGRPRAPR